MAKIIKAVDGNTTASHDAYAFTDFAAIFLQEKIYKFINLNNIFGTDSRTLSIKN